MRGIENQTEAIPIQKIAILVLKNDVDFDKWTAILLTLKSARKTILVI